MRLGLLASGSLTALLIGGGAPAFAACTAVTGAYTNPGGATVACITVQNTSFNGNLSNAGTIKPGNGAVNGTGIAIINSTITGQISNAGVISVGGFAITVDHTSEITGGIGNAGTISAGENGIGVAGPIFTGGISNSGRITANSTAISVHSSTFTGGISNSGTISAGAGIRIFASTFAGGISNSGAISAHGSGISVNGVTQFSGGIANSGTISAGGGAGISVGSYSTFSGGISNSGAISAANSGIYIDYVSTFTGGISNSGTISGTVGIGVIFVTQFGTSSAGGGITNSGTISVTAASSGIGILTEGVTTFAGGISNAGTISGGILGIDVENVSVFTGGISNSGTINTGQYGLRVSSVAQFGSSSAGGGIVNSGTISASRFGIIVGGGSVFFGGITNSGAISVTASTGAGISVENVATFIGGINNSGTIRAAGKGIFVSGVAQFGTSSAGGGIINSGAISGSVGILVTNSGAVSIFDSGTIVGTGGTAVDLTTNAAGNTFTLGPGYSITGLVKGQGADTFQFGGTGSGNFNLSSIGAAQQYRGFTAFNVVSGTWNTTGTFGQAQSWNVNGGTLAGTGTFASVNVNNGGTLAPGTPGVAGTVMTINGNLAFASGATYLVTLNGTSASHANVTGNVTLNGALDIVLLPGSYNGKTAYDILDPASISGRFSSVSVAGAPGLSGGLSFSSTDAFLNLTANVGGSGGLNANQQGVANSINTFFNNGGTLPAGFFPAFSQTGSSLGNTLAQLSGEPATDAGKGANQLMTDFMELMLDPTAGGGGNISGGGASGFAPEQETSLPADVARAYAEALKAPQAQESQNSAPQSFDQRWSAWGSAFGGASFIDGNAAAGTNNVTASDYGFAAGMERHLTPDTVYGFGLAGGGTNWSLAQALGSGRSDSFQAGVYAKTHWGPLYLSGALAFADHWFTTDRIALGDQLRATFTGQSYAARGEVGYRYAVPVSGAIIGVTPYAALQAQDFHTPSYSETDLTGGGLGLSYASANATDTRSELGARFDNLQIVNGMPLVLRGRLAWAHDWYTDAAALNAAFQALPGSNFTVNGAAPPKNSALTTAAAELHITQNWTAIAKFDGEFASGAQTYGGTGTLKYSW